MTTQQQNLVLETVPVLKENGVLLTKYFYNRMFTHHPELKNMFNMGNQQNDKQQTALALAVLSYAENIANPAVLLPVIDRIGQKHASLDIRPEHYSIVGHHLIASIQEVLGEAATPAIVEAWRVAYQQLAMLMSNHEATLYGQKIDTENGWTGWRPFVVEQKITESEEITSFYLYPADGGKVTKHLPGQFISVRIFLPELQLNQSRQYSISSAPNNEYYRISVKRESGKRGETNGMISNRLHDHVNVKDIVEITSPSGNFVLARNLNAPVTLISGGVGVTPLLSMLQCLISKNHQHTITWLHGCRNKNVHAFKQYVDDIARQHLNFSHYTFYNSATQADQQAGILTGILDIADIPQFKLNTDGHYFICGPAVFITKQYNDLIAKGIDNTRIHFEEFGPQVLSLN